MTAGNKAKVAATTANVTQLEAETQDEIAEIMNEIQTLQKSMSDVQKPRPPTAPKLKSVPVEPEPATETTEATDALEEFHGSGDEPSMEETLGSMKGDPDAASLLDSPSETEETTQAEETAIEAAETPESHDADVTETQEEPQEDSMTDFDDTDGTTGADSQDGQLTMTLSGNMTLKLKYAFGGQEVSVGFKDGNLRIALADGTEFKVPVARKKLRAA